jgi:hypothetical protein
MIKILLLVIAIPLAVVGGLLAMNRALPAALRHRTALFLACAAAETALVAATLYERHAGLAVWFPAAAAFLYFALAFQHSRRVRRGE